MVLLSIDWTNLHELLRSLYDEMMPLCEDMASVAKGVAGIGALFYVAYRVWQSLARAEEIDVFPLFRPFVLGLCIMFFPTIVLGTINGILSPVCSATSSLVEQQTFDMKRYQEEKDELEREAMLRDPAKAFLVSDEEFDKKIDELGWSLGDMDTMINMYGQKAVYDMGEKVRQWFRELLELFFQAASLLIDTLRTFFLIVLSILGPISFALAVYDGFQSTLTTLHLYLLMATRGRPVRGYPLTHTDTDVAAGHQADARSDIHTGRVEQRILYIHDYRYHRLLLCAHSVLVDYTGRRCGSLRAEGQRRR